VTIWRRWTLGGYGETQPLPLRQQLFNPGGRGLVRCHVHIMTPDRPAHSPCLPLILNSPPVPSVKVRAGRAGPHGL
jgi:hypothetical protein